MRAFRPSRFGSIEDPALDGPAEEQARLVKVELYAKRAAAHQPLFDDAWNVRRDPPLRER